MPLEVKRRLSPDDLAAVTDLLDAATRADGVRPLGEEQWLALVQGGDDSFVAALDRDAGTGALRGYAQATRTHDQWPLELVVHPDHREHHVTIGVDLLRAVLDAVAGEGGGRVQLWVRKPTVVHDEVARAVGLSGERDLLQMRIPLPAEQPPAEFVTRAFEPGHDERAWLDVNNRAFRGHPEQSEWDVATLEARERQPWFDPEGFRVHDRDGRLAGFCWTKVHAGEHPPVGEIYVIAVDPDFAGQGLGRALVLDGLAWLAAQGLRHGMLYTEADNHPAVRLYENIGFAVDHIDRAYAGEVASDVDAHR